MKFSSFLSLLTILVLTCYFRPTSSVPVVGKVVDLLSDVANAAKITSAKTGFKNVVNAVDKHIAKGAGICEGTLISASLCKYVIPEGTVYRFSVMGACPPACYYLVPNTNFCAKWIPASS
ncbi:hypothetical protein ACHQM5_009600 [Ranunculus cassubicifolius]